MEENTHIKEAYNYLKYKKVVANMQELANKIGAQRTSVSAALNGNGEYLTPSFCKRFNQAFSGIFNEVWLLTGEGEMLKTEKPEQEIKEISFEDAHNYPKGVLIPYFADTYTRGGLTDRMPCTDITEKETSYINAGSLFAKATSALKHFGDSMIEYPSGCVLFCREVEHPSLLVNGLPYVIETKEYRVTKKIHDKGEFIRAFSTNEQKFPDGSLIYAPFDIPKSEIIRLHQILGYAYLCI